MNVKNISVPKIYGDPALLLPKFYKAKEVPYSEILQQVSQGEVDCGLLIHESTFHIKEAGLLEVFHLADLWQDKTNDLPLPGPPAKNTAFKIPGSLTPSFNKSFSKVLR